MLKIRNIWPLLLALVYAVSPIDLHKGPLDDIIVILICLVIFLKKKRNHAIAKETVEVMKEEGISQQSVQQPKIVVEEHKIPAIQEIINKDKNEQIINKQ